MTIEYLTQLLAPYYNNLLEELHTLAENFLSFCGLSASFFVDVIIILGIAVVIAVIIELKGLDLALMPVVLYHLEENSALIGAITSGILFYYVATRTVDFAAKWYRNRRK